MTEDTYRLIAGNWAPWNLPKCVPLSFYYKACKGLIRFKTDFTFEIYVMCSTMAQIDYFFALVKMDKVMNPAGNHFVSTNAKRIYNDCTPIPIHKISSIDDKTNRLGVMGAEICCELNNKRRKKDYLLPHLTGLRLDYGWHLDRDQPDERGTGDVSRLYTVSDNGEEDRDPMHYLKRFRIINEDGFWQMYLLYNAIRVMPAWCHGLYVMRGYIFTLSDIKYIENMLDSDKATYSQKKLLLPKIKILKNSANIKVTYWSDHEGLCRETVKISVDDDGRMTSIQKTKRDVLVHNHIIIHY